MFYAWLTLVLFLSGGRAFMIHNTKCSLCLEDSATGEVLLKECNLDSEFQQWVWIDQNMLMCVASSRCLSAKHPEVIQTESCQGQGAGVAGLMWDCDNGRLISRNASMLLSEDSQRLILTHFSKHSKWRSVDKGDICQEKLRFRRASDETDEFEIAEDQQDEQGTMTEEEREYLRWYYRTEDPTTWKFVMLGLSFICLLVGFLLLGMGAMANKSRRKIAKYKAAAAALAQNREGEVMKVISPLADDNCDKPPSSPSAQRLLHENNFPTCDSEVRAGNIVVTWKDGNTSCLYSDHSVQEESQAEEQEEKQEVEQEVEQEEVLAAELEVHNGAYLTE